MTKHHEQEITTGMLAAAMNVEEEEAARMVKAYVGEDKPLTIHEAGKAALGAGLSGIFRMKQAEIRKVLDENDLGAGNRVEVARIFDDGVVVCKVRMREFRRRFQTAMDPVLNPQNVSADSAEEGKQVEE